MGARWTVERMAELFASKGCELLETEYKDVDLPVAFRCHCGEIGRRSISTFKKSPQCRKCRYRAVGAASKPSYEAVKAIFEANGCELVETSYKDSSTPMDYRCSCGNTSKICLTSLERGSRCKECGKKKIGKSHIKFDFEHVRKYFKDHGCVLLEQEYSTTTTPMRYRCKCGREGIISFHKLKARFEINKGNCKGCAGLEKPEFGFVRDYFAKRGCKLLATEYRTALTRMPYECHCGRPSVTTWASFQRGMRCAKCAYELKSGETHCNWNPDREEHELIKGTRKRCYAILYASLKATGHKKTSKCFSMIGYTPRELKRHVVNHPNWPNVKGHRWAIDHIFPISAFVRYGILDLKLINCLENLQPILVSENSSKGGNFDTREFEEWLRSKGVDILSRNQGNVDPQHESYEPFRLR